jgi:hypothetical protein
MNISVSVASIVSSVATCVALIFAGFEFRRSRRQDRHNRKVEIEGVAVSWRPPEVPKTPQDASGRATWEYEFTAYNPGELPISDVRVEIHFAIPVVRVRYDGHLDVPTQLLVLEGTPVLAGHGTREWRRRLVMDYEKAKVALRQTRAVISFIDPEDSSKRHINYWPKQLWPPEVRSSIDGDTATSSLSG